MQHRQNNNKKTSRRPVVRQPNADSRQPQRVSASRTLYANTTRPGPYQCVNEKCELGVLATESHLEAVVSQAMRLDPRVRLVRSQPAVVSLKWQLWETHDEAISARLAEMVLPKKEAQLWYPDFELYLHGHARPIWVEVKPADKIQNPKVLEKQRLAADIVPRLGFDYLLILSSDFSSMAISNIKLLASYRRVAPNLSLLEQAQHHLRQGPLSVNALALVLGCSTLEVYSLLAHGLISTSLEASALEPQTCSVSLAHAHTLHTLPLHRLVTLEGLV